MRRRPHRHRKAEPGTTGPPMAHPWCCSSRALRRPRPGPQLSTGRQVKYTSCPRQPAPIPCPPSLAAPHRTVPQSPQSAPFPAPPARPVRPTSPRPDCVGCRTGAPCGSNTRWASYEWGLVGPARGPRGTPRRSPGPRHALARPLCGQPSGRTMRHGEIRWSRPKGEARPRLHSNTARCGRALRAVCPPQCSARPHPPRGWRGRLPQEQGTREAVADFHGNNKVCR